MAKYTITGKDKQGKRFTIDTYTPQHYNIWQRTLWLNSNEISKVTGLPMRKKVRSY